MREQNNMEDIKTIEVNTTETVKEEIKVTKPKKTKKVEVAIIEPVKEELPPVLTEDELRQKEIERVRKLRENLPQDYSKKVLQIAPRKGFIRRCVNELQGRVEELMARGWSLVKGNHDECYERTQDGNQKGSVVRRVVNRGFNAPAKTAVFMEIPEEFYNEDYKNKQKDVDAIEKQLTRNAVNKGEADFGEYEQQTTK